SARAVDLLHESRDDEVRLRMISGRHELPPRNDTDDREVHPYVDDGDGDGADQNRPRDDASRVADLVADVAHVVIAEVVVDPDARRRTESEEESQREVERAGWKIEGETRIEVRGAGENHS